MNFLQGILCRRLTALYPGIITVQSIENGLDLSPFSELRNIE
jgi:hypothetical protein